MKESLKKMFERKSVEGLLRASLDDEQRMLIVAEDAFEYAKAMTSYHAVRIAQLKVSLADIERSAA